MSNAGSESELPTRTLPTGSNLARQSLLEGRCLFLPPQHAVTFTPAPSAVPSLDGWYTCAQGFQQ